MKITKRQLRQIIKGSSVNEGFFDKLKSAVGLGKDEQEMLLDIQRAFEQIADGVNNMVTLGKAGSRMHAKWGSLLDAAPDNMPQKMPPDAMDPRGTGHFNIFTAIKSLDGSALGSADLAGAAPDAAEEMNRLFSELSSSAGPRVSKSLLRKIGGLGSKILDEYNEFGPDDDGASLEAFYDVFQDALESEAKMAWTPEFWWETHGDEIAGINEGRMKITKRQLRKIIKEAIDVMNSETGELLIFDDQPDAAADGGNIKPDAPEAAALDMMKRLGITASPDPEWSSDGVDTYPLPNEQWEMMQDELYGKRAARKSKADKERLDIDNLLQRADKWAREAGQDYMADNREFPDTHLEDIAWDLSDAAELEFQEDEWNEMLAHFDWNPDDLRMYIADMIAGAGDAIEG